MWENSQPYVITSCSWKCLWPNIRTYKRAVKCFFLSVMHACVAGKICLMFLQLTRYLICKISQVDIKYTNKKKSGSAILWPLRHFLCFCVFFIFAIKHIIKCFYFSAHGSESQHAIPNNNIRKCLENTLKFTFDFVAFLFSLSIVNLSQQSHSD